MGKKAFLNLAQGVRDIVTEEMTFEHYVRDVHTVSMFIRESTVDSGQVMESA